MFHLFVLVLFMIVFKYDLIMIVLFEFGYLKAHLLCCLFVLIVFVLCVHVVHCMSCVWFVLFYLRFNMFV